MTNLISLAHIVARVKECGLDPEKVLMVQMKTKDLLQAISSNPEDGVPVPTYAFNTYGLVEDFFIPGHMEQSCPAVVFGMDTDAWLSLDEDEEPKPIPRLVPATKAAPCYAASHPCYIVNGTTVHDVRCPLTDS